MKIWSPTEDIKKTLWNHHVAIQICYIFLYMFACVKETGITKAFGLMKPALFCGNKWLVWFPSLSQWASFPRHLGSFASLNQLAKWQWSPSNFQNNFTDKQFICKDFYDHDFWLYWTSWHRVRFGMGAALRSPFTALKTCIHTAG